MDHTPIDIDSDIALALSWQKGDVRAYEKLVERHLDPVRRFLIARCRNSADADDLCQEVFLEVCRNIQHFTSQKSFTGWLYTIARRRSIDLWRKSRPMEVFDADRHGGINEQSPSQTGEEREEAVEAWNKVHAMLPENQAIALWLKIQGGHSIQEIAEIMSHSPENVRVLLFRARRHLALHWHPTESIPVS